MQHEDHPEIQSPTNETRCRRVSKTSSAISELPIVKTETHVLKFRFVTGMKAGTFSVALLQRCIKKDGTKVLSDGSCVTTPVSLECFKLRALKKLLVD